MKIKQFVILAICLCLLNSCTKSNNLPNGQPLIKSNFSDSFNVVANDGEILIDKGDTVALYYSYETNGITVVDLRNGFRWDSGLDVEAITGKTEFDYVKNLFRSMFIVSCVKTNEMKQTPVNVLSSSSDMSLAPVIDGNTLRIYSRIAKYGIGFCAEFSIVNDELCVRIPAEELVEQSSTKILNIQVMPFFGAATSQTDGYVLYPDGCGALMEFSKVPTKSLALVTKKIELPIYGNEIPDIDAFNEAVSNEMLGATLPLFGICQNKNAFLSYMTQGEAEASVNIEPQNQIVAVNRAYFSLRYRYNYDILASTVDIQIGNVDTLEGDNKESTKKVNKKISGQVYDSTTLKQDVCIRYAFLQGDEANYSGMAKVYRNHLLSENIVNSKLFERDDTPIAIDVFMGIRKAEMLYDVLLPMTTFKQVESIASEILDAGTDNLLVKLVGWSKGGYGIYPQPTRVDRKYGGLSQLKELSSFAAERNFVLLLDNNLIAANADTSGFSKRSDVIEAGNGLPVMDRTEISYWKNIFAIKADQQSLLASSTFQAASGLHFSELGQLVNYDYNNNGLVTRQDTISALLQVLASTREQAEIVTTDGGNNYLAGKTDYLYRVPIVSSQLQMSDSDVPFLQMVLHGLVPYSALPGNLFYDHNMMMLLWIEYGCCPYYEITYQKTEMMRDTEYNTLFSSHFSEWKDTILQTTEIFNNDFKGLWKQQMVYHKKIGLLAEVGYANGTTVYVNYSDEEIQTEDGIVSAMNYLVKAGGDGK